MEREKVKRKCLQAEGNKKKTSSNGRRRLEDFTESFITFFTTNSKELLLWVAVCKPLLYSLLKYLYFCDCSTGRIWDDEKVITEFWKIFQQCPNNTPKHKQIHKLLQLMFLLSFRSAFPSCWEATRVSGATASELQLPFHLEKSSSNMQCQRMLARPTSVEICSA